MPECEAGSSSPIIRFFAHPSSRSVPYRPRAEANSGEPGPEADRRGRAERKPRAGPLMKRDLLSRQQQTDVLLRLLQTAFRLFPRDASVAVRIDAGQDLLGQWSKLIDERRGLISRRRCLDLLRERDD